MIFSGLGILGYIYYKTSLHECKFLIQMNLNCFFFYLTLQRRHNSIHQIINIGMHQKLKFLKLKFLMWVKAFWTVCGYDFPVPMGGGEVQVFFERRPKTNETTSLNLSQCTAYHHLLILTSTKLDRPKACRTGK